MNLLKPDTALPLAGELPAKLEWNAGSDASHPGGNCQTDRLSARLGSVLAGQTTSGSPPKHGRARAGAVQVFEPMAAGRLTPRSISKALPPNLNQGTWICGQALNNSACSRWLMGLLPDEGAPLAGSGVTALMIVSHERYSCKSSFLSLQNLGGIGNGQ